jgi:hypothetical protein
VNRKLFKNRIVNVRDERTLKFRKEVHLSADFQALWDKIKHRTRYRVTFVGGHIWKAGPPQIPNPKLIFSERRWRQSCKWEAIFDDDYLTFILSACPAGIDVPVGSYFLSKLGIDGHRYRLGHPLAQHLIGVAGARKLNGAAIIFDYTAWPQTAVRSRRLSARKERLLRTSFRSAALTIRITSF